MLTRETFDCAVPDALGPRLNKIEMDENLSVLKPSNSVGHASRSGYSQNDAMEVPPDPKHTPKVRIDSDVQGYWRRPSSAAIRRSISSRVL